MWELETSTPHSVHISTDTRKIARFLPIWFVCMRFGQMYKTFH